MSADCLEDWKTIIDHLMTHDKTTFRDFLSRMSVNQSGSLKLFTSKDQENEQRAQLAKRLAFILFCSEKDQYQRYMPEIQEKLIECLRVNSSAVVQSQILLCFRVLILRMSHHHLTSLWPFIYTEMFQTFLQIENELLSDAPIESQFRRSHSGSQLQKLVSNSNENSWMSSQSNGFSQHSSSASLQLFLYACKLLDLTIALPAESLPQFQMYRWAFVGDVGQEGASPLEENKTILNHLNNNIGNVDKSPSPTPSRTSSTGSGVKAITSAQSFEPYVIRIERLLRNRNSSPTMLQFRPGYPLLVTVTLRTILELHPFFYTLVKVSQANTNCHTATESSGRSVSTLSNGSAHRELPPITIASSSTENVFGTMETAASYIDKIMELDFLEELSN
jgi:hemoglobin-like flavoprotein